MKKSIATIFMLGSMVLASTALAQSRVHAYRGTLLNGRIDVPFLPQGAIIPLPIPIQGTFGGVWDIPLLASRSGTIYSTLLNGYIDLPLPRGTLIPTPIFPIHGTLGNNRIDLPLPPF